MDEEEEILDETEDHITGSEEYGDFESAEDYWHSFDGEID